MTDSIQPQPERSYSVTCAGGWWPPGHGEPGMDWDFERADLILHYDSGDAIDVCLVVGDGERALASVPIEGLLAAALAMAESRS